MGLYEITDRLNSLSVSGNYEIATLQEFRGKLKGSRTHKIFSKSTVFDNYAFHDGGRGELQFNIGYETLNRSKIFRYVVAFSLEPNISLKEPVESLSPKIAKFNEYVRQTPEVFKGLEMWVHRNDGTRSENMAVKPIPKDWVEKGNFIAIGTYFSGKEKINDDRLREILSLFDKLLPVYEFVETESASLAQVTDRKTKICWNKNQWTKPSGKDGKSKDKKSFENKEGYGHEEWLLDFDRLIDGYHYTALQGIGKYRDTYEGNTYNIALYSYNSNNKVWYWVGEIKNVEVVDKETSRAVLDEYRKKGWLEQMANDVKTVGGTNFYNHATEYLFSIRFKPSDYTPSGIPIGKDQKINHTRYTLLHKEKPLQVFPPLDYSLNLDSSKTKESKSIKRTISERTIECEGFHNDIQSGLKKWLESNFPGQPVSLEGTKGMNSIDLVRTDKDGEHIFYEVKTYGSVKSSIREALGQLLEYAYFPTLRLAKKLIIVSHKEANADEAAYIKHLNKVLGISIGYMQFDYAKSEVLQEI